MKTDIILCGVGGQGILKIATVIGEAAARAGICLKQAEVHGMSQRGGDVQSNLRLSTEPIWSDLIPCGKVDLIISMEPMEALRYVSQLSPEGTVVTACRPFVNIPNYPEEEAVQQALDALPHCVKIDIEEAAKKAGNPRCANIALLAAASPYLQILGTEYIKEAMRTVFAPKGEAVIEANLRCFDQVTGR